MPASDDAKKTSDAAAPATVTPPGAGANPTPTSATPVQPPAGTAPTAHAPGRTLAPAPAETLAPGTFLGGCQIGVLLGHGGMGAVYEGLQLSLNRRVALKVLLPRLAQSDQFVARFDRESASLAALNHPNIVAIYDRGKEGDLYYFVMEFVAGESLRRRMKKGRVPVAEAGRIVGDILAALDYAHANGVVHRDIKPENVLIDKDGRVKVADFGIAHVERGSYTEPERGTGVLAARGNMTLSGLGTPSYVAPEQRARLRSCDHRIDLYSAGVVLYELLAGRLPQDAKDPLSALPPDVPGALARLVGRMMAPAAVDRPATAAAAREALARILVDLDPTLPPVKGGTTVRVAAEAPTRLRPASGGPAAPGAAAARPATPAPGTGVRLVLIACVVAALLTAVVLVRIRLRSNAGADDDVPGPGAAGHPKPGPVTPPPAGTPGHRPGPLPTATPGPRPGPRPTTDTTPGGATVPRPPDPPVAPTTRTIEGFGPYRLDVAAALEQACADLSPLDEAMGPLLARSAHKPALDLVARFRAEHTAALAAVPPFPPLIEGLNSRIIKHAEQAHADFEAARRDADKLRAQEKFAAAAHRLDPLADTGLPEIDGAAAQLRTEVRAQGFTLWLAKARAAREARHLAEAIAAWRIALEFTDAPAPIAEVNREIERMKDGVKERLRKPLGVLANFARNGRYDLTEDFRAVDQDPNLADLRPFLASVRADLASFRSGTPAPKDLGDRWLARLDKFPIALGDRQGIPVGERCGLCAGTGRAACTACGGAGRAQGSCGTCEGKGKVKCAACAGEGTLECAACGGKGEALKKVWHPCERCGTSRCSECLGSGYTMGQKCPSCRGSGREATPGKLNGRVCSFCEGTGKLATQELRPCEKCGGSGKAACAACAGKGLVACAACEAIGTGMLRCGACGGAGNVPCGGCKGSGRTGTRGE